MFGLSTLFSNHTDHKLQKRQANQKHQQMSLRLSEHDDVHKFADTLYRRFRVSAMQTNLSHKNSSKMLH